MANRHLQLTDELQERASLYAAGALPEAERAEFARHLNEDGCAVCINEVREFEAAAGLMTFGTKLEAPSANVKQRLMDQARQSAASASAARPGPQRRWVEWIAGLTAVATTAALFVVMNDNTHLRDLTDSLSSRISQLESELTSQRLRVARLSTITSPQVRVVNLAGQGDHATASGRIFWDRNTKRWFFYATNLPPAPTGKSYQLWFVPVNGNPVSASVFNTAADGAFDVEIQVPDSVTAIKAAAVTTEPAGGVPQPTGAFALLGAIE